MLLVKPTHRSQSQHQQRRKFEKADGTRNPDGVDAYSQHHTGDKFSGSSQRGTKTNFVSNETAGGIVGRHSTSSFINDITAFTQAFAKNTNDSKNLVQDFVKKMQQYGIAVTVQE